jgi:hypothetical protein
MDITVLYVEIYVTFLLAVIVYVLYELFKVEKEQAAGAAAAAPQPIAFPRFAVWLVGIGMFLVIAGWLVSFPVNEAVKKMVASSEKAEKKTEGAGQEVEKKTDETGAAAETKIAGPSEEVQKKIASAETIVTNIAKWLFFPGTILVAISLLVFGYSAAVHTRPAPWFNTAGIIAIAVGILAFCASAAVGCIEKSIHSWTTPIPEVILVTGLLSPFFFVGVPLGIYWLSRGKQAPIARAGKRK